MMRFLASLAIITLGFVVIPIHSVVAEPTLEMSEMLHKYTIQAGKLIKVKSEVANNTPGTLTFAYIVQIKDSNNVTVQLSWMDGIKVAPKEKIEAMQSWVPEKPGEYTVDIFVWQSIANPDPMSPVRKAIAVVE